MSDHDTIKRLEARLTVLETVFWPIFAEYVRGKWPNQPIEAAQFFRDMSDASLTARGVPASPELDEALSQTFDHLDAAMARIAAGQG
jgi:hypothetical protein